MKLIKIFIPLYLLSVTSYAQLIFGQNRKKVTDAIEINYASPRELEIADIEIRGLQFLDNNALTSLSGLKVGDKIKIPGDEISFAINKLWKQGIIGNIAIFASKIEGNQVWLVIELSERPRLINYEFDGVSKSHRTEIEDDLELTKGKIITDVVIKNTELTVRKFYESKGFLNAGVTISQRVDTIIKNSAVLMIEVDKGRKVKIYDINFHGNETFSDTKLRSKFKKTGETPRFSLPSSLLVSAIKLANPKHLRHFMTHKDTATAQQFRDQLSNVAKLNFFKSSKFVKEEFVNDKAALISFLNSKGYRDAVIKSDTNYAINKKHMNIDIEIFEGQKYYFRNINWEGNFIYDDATLAKVLGVKKGDIYDLELIQTKLNYDPTGVDVSSLYMDDGYLFFNINPVEIGVSGDSIDLEMRVFEGGQATIKKVLITGNEKTKDYVVRRELRTIPGQKFSRELLIRTQRELSQLGYFDPQKVNPIPIPNMADETVDIEWELVEQPSDQIELSGGWGGYYGFVGTLGVSFNNFSIKEALKFNKFPPMGDGQRLSVRAQANGKRYQSYTVSFQEPWLGGKRPNSFGISYNHSIQRYLNYQDNTTIGSLSVNSFSVSLGRRVNWPDDFFVISNAVSFSKYSLYNYQGFSLGFATGDANSFVFNTTVSRRSSDNPMYPQRGSDISLSINMTPPYSMFNDLDYETSLPEERFKWVEYHKWNFDLRYYLPVIPKLIFAPRIHFGFIGSYTDKAPVGPFERFVLGGDGLTGQNFILGTDVIGLRGYPNPQQSARRETSLTPYDSEANILGGIAFTKYILELRYPVSLNPTATIYLLTFVEGGNAWNNSEAYNPYKLYRSAGIGARIFMPAFGLLGIDYGYGFDAIPGANERSGGQFHFSIGQQIR
jgi:outer membrane protein insertion porin family|tara:strand:+ start:313 stop:2985 length:2673 start_codon:yes stop_codon:yes gene_type:complete